MRVGIVAGVVDENRAAVDERWFHRLAADLDDAAGAGDQAVAVEPRPAKLDAPGHALMVDDGAVAGGRGQFRDADVVAVVEGRGAEVSRDRWTLSLQFTFLETVEPELMIVNPMGILITYLRGDRALVTG